jgi:hypothetical protein
MGKTTNEGSSQIPSIQSGYHYIDPDIPALIEIATESA